MNLRQTGKNRTKGSLLHSAGKRGLLLAAALSLTLAFQMAAFAGWVWNEQEAAWYYFNVETEQLAPAEIFAALQASGKAEETDAADAQQEETETAVAEALPLYTGWVNDGSSYYYVRDSRMVTGWEYIEGQFYYMKPDGVMAANEWIDTNFYCGETGAVLTDTETPDGVLVDENGSRIRNGQPVEPATPYLEVAKANPDFYATFGVGNDGEYRISREPLLSSAIKYCYKAMQIYAKDLRVSSGSDNPLLYEGDAFLNLNAMLDLSHMAQGEQPGKLQQKSKKVQFQSYFLENPRFNAVHVQFNPAGYITSMVLQ